MYTMKQRCEIINILLGAALVHPIDARQAGRQVTRDSEGLKLPIYGLFLELGMAILPPIP